jgi:hypothetical protein
MTKLSLTRSRIVLLGAFVLFFSSHSLCEAKVNQPRIINRHGREIPSIYSGAIPNPAVLFELQGGPAIERSCSLIKAAYHPSDKGRFVQVYNCTGHYQVPTFRSCGLPCGGTESWTYGDSMIATYCDGAMFEDGACATGNCRDETTCFECP